MSWNETWRKCLIVICKDGEKVTRYNSDRNIREILSYNFCSNKPQDRLIYSEEFNLNIFQCIGQFLWITQGDFKLDNIKYYQPKAERFSDDGYKMIGAYGTRLFSISHLDQINHVIKTLKDDLGKRKAIASVYLPQFDQHEKFNEEVPCTLNLQYLIRNDEFHAITYMRNQDAHKVLPYDFFIFTLLQEYIKNVLYPSYRDQQIEKLDGDHNNEQDKGVKMSKFMYNDLELGKYYHYSGSFHIYETDETRINKMLSKEDCGVKSRGMVMDPMPEKDTKLNLFQLNNLESLIRTLTIEKENVKLEVNFDNLLELIDKRFNHEYWKQLGYVLLTYSALTNTRMNDFCNVYEKLDSIYKYFVDKYIKNTDNMDVFYNLIEK